MPKLESVHGAKGSAAGANDVKRLLGDLEAAATSEILSLQPSIVELEEVAMRAAGDGDVLGKGGKPMSARVAQILEIMNPEADED
jgi:hypothetical protein